MAEVRTVKRQYEVESKTATAKPVEDQCYTVREAADWLGSPQANLTRCLQQYRQGKLLPRHKQVQPTAEEAELRRLRQENQAP